MKATALGVGGAVIGMAIVLSGLMAAPSTADAWWWPWWKQAHAQENDNATSTVTVTVKKFVDGQQATASSSDNLGFTMDASWDDDGGIGEGSGSFTLSSDNSYSAETSAMLKGADYSLSERLDGSNVGASCADGKPFALAGYTSGKSLNEAKDKTISSSSPSLTDISKNMHIIVWNESCDGNGTTTPDGELVGEVIGGSNGGTGELVVTDIEAEKTTATANGTFADGWKYVFHVTVPSDETDVAMKFNNWLHSNGSSTIPVANNMRISSEQASSSSTVLLTAADTYSSPLLTMTEDLDEEEDGLQVEILVEVAVPAGTMNGTYSTDYGIRSE